MPEAASLPALLRRSSLQVLGLNSGTSCDGLDLAVVRVRKGARQVEARLLGGGMISYPAALRRELLHVAEAADYPLDRLARLDQSLGYWYAQASARWLRKNGRRFGPIDLIASHGQTIRHLPSAVRQFGSPIRATWQIGSLSRIAAVTGLVTIGDFRQADIAIGGEGAPITTAAVDILTRRKAGRQTARLILNIGGMANYFYFPSGGTSPQAADCGPGNVLSDILAMRLFGRPYDAQGKLARSGRIDQPFVDWLNRQFGPRRSPRATRSTGREQFGFREGDLLAAQGRKRRLRPEDILASTISWTAARIIRSLPVRLPGDTSLYLTGGGSKNSFLTDELKRYAGPTVTVAPVEVIGLNGDLLEAASFAVMGAAALFGRGLPTPGASTTLLPISGLIAQPPVGRQS